jgi:hypothetical protein
VNHHPHAIQVPPANHRVAISLTPVPTAPHVFYAVSYDPMGQGWIYFMCQHCHDVSQKPCVDPRNRLSHWVGWYAAQHAGC